MNASKLKSQCLSDPEHGFLTSCFVGENLVGQAFAATWDYRGGSIGWITQLVVDRDYRRRHIATTLLQHLQSDPVFGSVSAFGVASSGPATCHILAKLVDVPISNIDTKFISDNAERFLKSTTVHYLKSDELRGSLFGSYREVGGVFSVFTSFYIDHTEPLEILKSIQQDLNGALLISLMVTKFC
ncbi:hypothetical protein SERLA73DRAFT_186155 [Serpula lacrymans var. lacrymans S7.3]|uniref:N-acetyltransferase domain-containing protein n=2 Tax=Serpula lacrymans var. lacrymans TaxID=341189 RepID=F8Q5E1_SERL3|nr:uncharacterized protein SERLADRAFT_475028 [Serpula lacrymans var. lacrymans S7.9]EGN96412.1 hypothetical protein SERLA73DRAFT_186155 [Serpula lacrymans var. lacrymans S7.3]EGO21952.1 hypothetical protein SERLADRAFT_475028 [Serpula lacrymans var. lacrymans S7.9]